MSRFRRLGALFVLSLSALLQVAPASGAITIGAPGTLTPNATLGDGDTVTLNPNPLTYLGGATAAMQARLAAEFPAFTFNYNPGGATLGGNLAVSNYEATNGGGENGGGLLIATYTRVAADPLIADLRWIQMVDTNRPLGGVTTPYIDPRPNDDTLPFYWTTPEDSQVTRGNKTATSYTFSDNSSRTVAIHPELITWRGELVLASFDSVNNIVNVYDGLRWGWDLQRVPEPSSLALVLIVGVVGARRRRLAA